MVQDAVEVLDPCPQSVLLTVKSLVLSALRTGEHSDVDQSLGPKVFIKP